MKLKKIIPIIIAVLAVCAVAVIIVMNAKDSASDAPSGLVQNQGNTSEPASDSTSEPTADPTVSTDPVDIQLAEFKEMLSTAREMLASGEVITLNRHDYHEWCLRLVGAAWRDAISFPLGSETITSDTAQIDAEYLEEFIAEPDYGRDIRYLMLLSWIGDKYPDCIVTVGEFPAGFDLSYSADLYLCIGYEDAGYETAEEFCVDLESGVYNDSVVAFRFDLTGATIELVGDEGIDFYEWLISR